MIKLLISLSILLTIVGCKKDPLEDRVGAFCSDGWVSFSTGRGTCSHHGGVTKWVTKRNLLEDKRSQEFFLDVLYPVGFVNPTTFPKNFPYDVIKIVIEDETITVVRPTEFGEIDFQSMKDLSQDACMIFFQDGVYGSIKKWFKLESITLNGKTFNKCPDSWNSIFPYNMNGIQTITIRYGKEQRSFKYTDESFPSYQKIESFIKQAEANGELNPESLSSIEVNGKDTEGLYCSC